MFKVRSKNKPGVIKTVYSAQTNNAGHTFFLVFDYGLWCWVNADSYEPYSKPSKKQEDV